MTLLDRFYDRMRHRDAFAAAREEPSAHGFDGLRGHKYCLLISFRRSGDPVPTPVWFGLDADGRLFVRTEADAANIRVAILTGRERGGERATLLDRLALGDIDLLIGTHALFQEGVAFHDLALAVVDEHGRIAGIITADDVITMLRHSH